MKIKKLGVFLLIFSVLLFLTGCSGSVQLHERMIIQGIGIDIDNSGYKITIQALDFKNPASENEPSIKVLELRGKTLFEALENASKQNGLTATYSQNLIVVIGNNAAARGVNQFLDFFIRHYEARPNVKICVSETNASDILSLETDSGVMKATDISDVIPNSLNSDILHFVARLQGNTASPYCAYMGVDTAEQSKSLTIKGIAFFSGDKLSGAVVDTECVGALAAMGIGNLGVYNLYIDNIGIVSLGLNKIKSTITPYIEEKGNTFEINIDIEASMLEVKQDNKDMVKSDEQFIIESQLSDEMKTICEQSIEKIIASKSDIFRFGKILMNSNPAYFKSISSDWKNIMQSFVYNVNVNSKLTITGTEI